MDFILKKFGKYTVYAVDLYPFITIMEGCCMNEEEYWESEPDDENYNDDESLGVYMIEEPEDIDLIVLPKLNFNLDEELDAWTKQLRKCKNKQQLKEGLRGFYAYVAGVVLLQEDIRHLQDKAKEVEFNIKSMGF
jgi:hypothetical protein